MGKVTFFIFLQVVDLISRGVTKFTLDMDRAIDNPSSSSHDNLLFSPISLTVTLAMVLLASAGKTFEEVARVLGLESGLDISHHSEMVHEIFGFLIQQFDEDYLLDQNAPQCKVAFGIFVKVNYSIQSFLLLPFAMELTKHLHFSLSSYYQQ
jgi:serine protease inhibitor